MEREIFTPQSLSERLDTLPAVAVYEQVTGGKSWADDMAEKVPVNLRPGLVRWVALGIYPGSFLTAVLENRLDRSFACADKNSWASLPDVLMFLLWSAPSQCHGAVSKCEHWADSGGISGHLPRLKMGGNFEKPFGGA